MKISRLGEAPDYRFSLANERTFLAWIRTALGFLAAGVGLDQLAPDFATPVIRELLALLMEPSPSADTRPADARPVATPPADAGNP